MHDARLVVAVSSGLIALAAGAVGVATSSPLFAVVAGVAGVVAAIAGVALGARARQSEDRLAQTDPSVHQIWGTNASARTLRNQLTRPPGCYLGPLGSDSFMVTFFH